MTRTSTRIPTSITGGVMGSNKLLRARGAAIVGAVLAVSSIAVLPAGADPAIPSRVVTGVSGPESAVWDPATQAWYVSVGGFSGSGGVVRILPGSDIAQPFVTGLRGPQGVSIHDGTMYVADGGFVRVIEMAAPGQVTSIPIRGASDLDVDPGTGDLYVSDLGGNAVWRIPAGTATPERFATINSPDGLYVRNGGVYISNFALGGAGGVYRFEIGSAARSTVIEIPGTTLDGLEPDGDDWLVTDFSKGHLWRVSPDGGLLPVGQLLPGSADLGMDPATRTIAVPNLLLNHITFLTI